MILNSTLLILYILLTHFVADFVTQTNKMAKNKSTSIKWLTIHTLTYFLIFTISGFGLYITLTIGDYNVSAIMIVLYCLVNAILHWVTDYFTSKQTKKLWEEKKVHTFFVFIGFDQWIHQVTLIMTFYLFFLI